jgi:hypothetical protein
VRVGYQPEPVGWSGTLSAGQLCPINTSAGAGRGEVLQDAQPQRGLFDHVQQRHQFPPGADLGRELA